MVFVCKECGKESLRWMGQCPACEALNSFYEQTLVKPVSSAKQTSGPPNLPCQLSELEFTADERWPVGIGELNRVLGGGLVPGEMVLIGGEPGIGKSTLLLQTAAHAAAERGKVVYIRGRNPAPDKTAGTPAGGHRRKPLSAGGNQPG